MLISGVALSVASLAMVLLRGGVVAWLGVVVFPPVLVAVLVERVRPPRIVVHPDSFETVSAFGRRAEYQYFRCSRFQVVTQVVSTGLRMPWLTFDYEGSESSWLQQLNASKVGGADRQVLLSGFDEAPGDIAALLNRRRATAIDRNGTAGQ